MTNDQLLDLLARRARLRRASKGHRALSMGPRLAIVKLARRGGRQVPVTARTFWGDRMRVVLPEPLSCEIFGYRYFEEGLSAFMLSEIGRGQRVYDVGAHFGYFTRLASKLVGSGGTVHSFEPTPRTFSVLAQNAAGLGNVTCNQMAVWHSRDKVVLKDFGPSMSMFNSLMAPRLPDDGSHEARDVEVDALSLDEYAEHHGQPDFVKIDAESAEWSILDGMAGMLDTGRPTVTVEVGDFDIDGVPTSRNLLDRIISHGYVAFDYRSGKIGRHVLQESYGYDNILLVAA